MKTFVANIIPKIKKHSEKLDNLTLLANQHWVVIDELKNSKLVYIFRQNSDLLISQNGKVEKGRWEYLGNDSLLIDIKDDSFLLRHGFFDSNVLALKVDGIEEYAFLVNESKYEGELNSIDKVLEFLEANYIDIIPREITAHQNGRVDSSSYNSQISPHESETERSKTNDVKSKGTGIENTYEDFDNHKISANNTIKSQKISPKETKLFRYRNKKGKVGFKNKNGEVVVECIYDGASDFKGEMAVVFVERTGPDNYGFINLDGDEIIPLIYEYAENFSEGFALVRMKNKFGFIDRNDKVVIPINYDWASSFKNGWAEVKVGKRKFKIDRWGNRKIV